LNNSEKRNHSIIAEYNIRTNQGRLKDRLAFTPTVDKEVFVSRTKFPVLLPKAS